MRIKFKKGMTPEMVAAVFLDVLRERGTVIGAVNIYIQEYGEDTKPIKDDGDEYLEYRPGKAGLRQYADYAADVRRGKMKAV